MLSGLQIRLSEGGTHLHLGDLNVSLSSIYLSLWEKISFMQDQLMSRLRTFGDFRNNFKVSSVKIIFCTQSVHISFVGWSKCSESS